MRLLTTVVFHVPFCSGQCEVLNSKEEQHYSVTCEDDPDNPVQASCPTQAWKRIADAICKASGGFKKQRTSRINGFERFGLVHRDVSSMLNAEWDRLSSLV